MKKNYIMVLITAPDKDSAHQIAEMLVSHNLAACVNIVPGITSFYRWQGKIQNDDELLLIVKTRTDEFDRLSRTVAAMHPYDLPEIIAINITDGLRGYLKWIDTELEKPTDQLKE